jgi:hypothetical protein
MPSFPDPPPGNLKEIKCGEEEKGILLKKIIFG